MAARSGRCNGGAGAVRITSIMAGQDQRAVLPSTRHKHANVDANQRAEYDGPDASLFMRIVRAASANVPPTCRPTAFVRTWSEVALSTIQLPTPRRTHGRNRTAGMLGSVATSVLILAHK